MEFSKLILAEKKMKNSAAKQLKKIRQIKTKIDSELKK